jgi:ubiquinone/menaquinone biosynthesis C-methylase UbiE
MDASGSQQSNRSYYDSFSKGYERLRGKNLPGGYHELLDELESEFVARYGVGLDVLEVGCGTGLVLQRIAGFARSARGVDLSPGMLDKAKARGLDVIEASATQLPFDDNTFDVTCSFKVLAHVIDIDTALKEMARVTRPGGHVLAEFYNPYSFRGAIKRFGPKLSVAEHTREGDVFTRFDPPRRVRELTPAGCTLIDSRGVRIVTPAGLLLRVPGLRQALRGAEHALCDGPLKQFAGFYIAVYRKDSDT